MNESLEKRVSMLERLLSKERARTKNVTTIKFTENDSSSTAAGVYAFDFFTEAGNKISFEVCYESKDSSLSSDVEIFYDELIMLSYKSIIGKNRLIVGGVATKKEGRIKIVFHSPSNVSQISATVSGIVEKNDFGSFVTGDYFEGNDYAFLYDGTKNRATLYSCENDELFKKAEFNGVKGGAIKATASNEILIALVKDNGLDVRKFTISTSAVTDEKITSVNADYVVFAPDLYVLDKGIAKKYVVNDDLSLALNADAECLYASEIAATAAFNKLCYKEYDGVWYFKNRSGKKTRLGKGEKLHVAKNKSYCSADGVIYEINEATGAREAKAYGDEYLPLGAGYIVRRGQNIDYKKLN